MKYSKLYRLSTILALLLVTLSCEKLDQAPENEFTDGTYWTSLDKAQSVLNTAYSQMLSSSRFFYNEALSDNAFNGRGDTEGVASLAAGIHDQSLARIRDEWNDRYAGIKSCNLFLGNIDRVPDADPTIKEQMIAEARFLRAFQHFQLMTWFGDVPLVPRDISLEEAQAITRSPKAEVLRFILDELEAAAAVLPTNTEYSEAERGKITSGAAIALKARVLLYEGRWEEVVSTCEWLINSSSNGSYSLFPSYEGLFLPENEYNSEDIL